MPLKPYSFAWKDLKTDEFFHRKIQDHMFPWIFEKLEA